MAVMSMAKMAMCGENMSIFNNENIERNNERQ
jgi:hypothetical protein